VTTAPMIRRHPTRIVAPAMTLERLAQAFVGRFLGDLIEGEAGPKAHARRRGLIVLNRHL
jgi:hypothetical protein